jgi:hypothetical protein
MRVSRLLLASFSVFAAVFSVGAVSPSVAFAQEVRISAAPPPPRVEVFGARPGPYHVWQGGSWGWHPEGRYEWRPGRWVVPPQGRTVWVRDEWVSYGGGYHLVPGHWRAVGERIPSVLARVAATGEPPPEQVETVMAAPPGEAWVHGHWSWDGAAYVWVPGHLAPLPEGHHEWAPGRWSASRGHWFYTNGYWR